MPQRMPSFWRRGMPRSQIQKSMIMPKTKPMTRPSSMSPCVPSDTSSMTRSNRRDPSRIAPPPIPMGAPSPWFCSSHSSSNSTDSKSDRGLPPCRREWNCARRRSTSVCENPARRLPSTRPACQRKPLCATYAGWSRGEGGGGGHSTGDRSPAHCLLRPYLGGPCRSQHPVQAAPVHSRAGASEALAHPVAGSRLSPHRVDTKTCGVARDPGTTPVLRTVAAPRFHAHLQQQNALLQCRGKDKGGNKSKKGPPLRKLLREQSRRLSSRTSLVCASPGGMQRTDGGRNAQGGESVPWLAQVQER